ncbi:MAG TPA: SUMF1/EgtB/PvdO family nonheme iron enzyme [Myxococcales bacterium]|jgi:formylglycine-generating enzyme required for sulfatase activity
MRPAINNALLSLVPAAVLILASCSPKGPCPSDMALVSGAKACIDRYEASLEGGEPGNPEGKGATAKAVSKQGALPAVKVSQLQAKAACANAGKRLCARAEWLAACKGESKRKFAYGEAFVAERCADRPLAKKRGEKPQPTGSLPDCRTPEGVYDLSGNVWEWLADTGPGGNPADLLGGGYGNEGKSMACEQEERLGQPVTQQGEAMGFRCCKDAAPAGK